MFALFACLSAFAGEDPDALVFDFMYRWENTDLGDEVRGWATAKVFWDEADDDPKACRARWARGLCGLGGFTTDDGGEGVAELGVARIRKIGRVRTITLVYDDTGAVYEGELRLDARDAVWEGVTWLEDDATWVGLWDEAERVDVESRRARRTRAAGR